ncbi:MAG: C69 family dipeptidase [Candidatus Marinimicrobia bacterium]|nr:C69 family dipeptidase [Candidatus Neomarinimicrobiota bacterium]
MKKTFLQFVLLLSISLLFLSAQIHACTNFLISKGASKDGSTMITFAADSHVLYGELYFTPAADHLPGEMLDIYEWDTGKYLGQIKQVPHTYSVVGNMNEHQVSIGETTWGGRSELRDSLAIMDYGSLMYVTLQRAITAREAIKIMGDLVEEYGYYSSGESFSVSDPNEVWIMEMIGKGPGKKGAVWVARRVTDGHICAHANQARIRQFPLKDPENCLYEKDVINLAREKGWFKGKDKNFSFADAYAPLDYGALRFCEARVWSMFRRAAPSLNLSTDYIKGVKGAKPLPLWVKPDKKLSTRDVMELMRDHFEDSDLDMSKDIGADPFKLPYRWRPLTWEVDSVEYFNERATSTQQTGFSFVAQARSWLPDPIGGIHWFSVDDTYSAVYVPMYCGIKEVPKSYAVGTGDFHHFTWESAFWVFNFVSNYCYLRYSDMIKDVRKVQRELEGKFMADQANVEELALKLYNESPQLAIDYLTEYSVNLGNSTVKRWKKLGEFLIYKYLDGNVKDELGKVQHPGYPKSWYRKIVDETGSHFKIIKLEDEGGH